MKFVDRRALREKQAFARELRRRSTPEESRLWRELRKNKLGLHFRRQHVLAGFIVDFYCPAARLIVELDGSHHLDQMEADHERDAILTGMGNLVLRFPNKAVRTDLASVLAAITKGIADRPQRGVPPSPDRGRGSGG